MNKKEFFKTLGQYPKDVREDEVYFPYSSIEATLKEFGIEENNEVEEWK